MGGNNPGWYNTAPDPENGQTEWTGQATAAREAELKAQQNQHIEHNQNIADFNSATSDGVVDPLEQFYDSQPPILEETEFEEGTNSDTYDHEVNVDTNFSGGTSEQGTQTTEEAAAGVREGTVYSTGNASVNSTSANDEGFSSMINDSITDSHQPGRANLSPSNIFNSVSNVFQGVYDAFVNVVDSVTSFFSFSWLSNNSTTLAEIDPLILDLDGDGIELTPFAEQHLYFDIDNDGSQERTGWVGKDDGMLVHDLNGDGKISDITETFSEYYTAAKGTGAIWDSSFAALASVDSNSDGVIDANDTIFDELKVWQDSNQDGITDAGELKTLAELDITELSLSDTADGAFIGGNEVKSNSTYQTSDGTTQTLAAVNFIADPNGLTSEEDGTGTRVEVQDGDATYSIGDDAGETVTTTEKDVTNIIGGIGDDVITGDEGNNWLTGSLGEDTLIGGAGNDFLIADAADIANTQDNIQGGDGFDIVQFVGDKGVAFNLQASAVEMAVGTDKADILVSGSSDQSIIDGGAGDDIIIGGSADDVLNGEEGDDTVYGHMGDDLIRGHRGDDKLVGGSGEDILQGGLGADVLSGGKGEDLLEGGKGNDHLDGGDDYDVAQYSGSYGDYTVVKNDDGTVTVTDRRANSPDGIDTLENIEALNFADINEVQLDNDNPLPVKDTVRATAEADGRTYRVAMSDLLANDLDYQGDALSLTEAFNAKGGTVSIEGDEVVFLLDEGFSGIPTFSYRIQDAKGNNGAQVGVTNSTETAEMTAEVTLILDHHPDDPNFVDQWYLTNINVLPVWEDYTGAGVTVGVFEPGPWDAEEYGQIDYSHPDLLPNIDAEALRTQNPNIEPTQHATLVAGVIAAARNDIGSVGVAYDATLTSEGIKNSDNTALLNWKNYDITNNSWGAVEQFGYRSLDKEIIYKLLDEATSYGRDGLGTIMVMAGGNDRQNGHDTNTDNLTNNRFSITVGAINAEGDIGNLQIAADPFSNPGASILVSAPGSNITSTSRLVENEHGSTFGSDFETTQGTSFAAPIVSGVVALMLEANPNLGWRDVQKILALTAKKIDDPNTEWQTNGATNVNGGGMHFSHDYGFGIVDAEAAVRLAESWFQQSTSANEEEAIYQSGTLDAAIPDNGADLTSTITVTDDLKLENVEVTLDLQHSQLGDVEIVLISPDGTESILVNRPGVAPSGNTTDRGHGAFDDVWTTSSTNHWGEDSAGDWTLVIRDKETGETGVLESWELRLFGEQDSDDDVYIFTSEFNGKVNGFQNETSGIDTINTAALTSDTVINLESGEGNINGYDVAFQLSAEEKAVQIAGIEALLSTKQQELEAATAEFTTQQNSLEAVEQKLIENPNILDDLRAVVTEKEAAFNQAKSNYDSWYESFGRGDVLLPRMPGDPLVLWDFDGGSSSRNEVKVYSYGSAGTNAYHADAAAYKVVVETYNTSINDVNNAVDEYNTTRSEVIELPELREKVEDLKTQVSRYEQELDILEHELSAANNVTGDAVIENVITGVGDDQLIGNEVDNVLVAGRGDDVLKGNGGDDTLYGGEGDDTYIWSQGDGNDVIIEIGNDEHLANVGADKLVFNDITSAQIEVSRNGKDIQLTILPTGEIITLSNYFLSEITEIDTVGNIYGAQIDLITFSDGEEWSLVNIEDRIGSNIFGTDGDDVLTGGKGDDVFYGEAGNDTYIWSQGDGDDVIHAGVEGAGTVVGTDGLVFSDVTSDQIELGQSGKALVIRVLPTNEFITLSDFYLSASTNIDPTLGLYDVPVDRITFADGEIWELQDIEDHIGSSFFGTVSNDVLNGSDADEVFEGRGGDDTINASNGDDTFIWSQGDGNDVITTLYGDLQGGGVDRLILKDITSDQLEVSREGYDIKLTMLSTGEVITLKDNFINGDYLNNTYKPLDFITFSDGEEWNLQDIEGRAYIDIQGTDGDDDIQGADANERIIAGEGDDTLIGNGGDDVFYYGEGDGNDTISGDTFDGNDTLVFTDLNPSDIEVTKHDGNIEIKVISTGHVIVLEGQLYGGSRTTTDADGVVTTEEFNLIQEIIFANGDSWSADYIANHAFVIGTGSDDYLSGSFGDDVIIGGLGDDFLEGSGGSDTYYYALGDGNDTISDWTSDNHLVFTDINPDDIDVTSSSTDIFITIKSTNETITIEWQHYDKSISSISFADGSVWSAQDLQDNAWIKGTSGDDIVIGSQESDRIIGHEGDDILAGFSGDDSYYYSQGDGNDLLFDWFDANTLVLTDLNPADITIANVNGDSALISILPTGETITVEEHFFRDALQAIRFANGVEWNREDMVANLTNSLSQEANFHYTSTDADLALSSTDGIKHLFFDDLNSADIEVANINNGDVVFTVISTGAKISISGQFIDEGFGFGVLSSIDFADGTRWSSDEMAENAWTLGTDGDDYLTGSSSGSGADRIIGGKGDDILEGDWGDDTYYYNLGDGNDTVVDLDGWNDLVLTEITPDDILLVIDTNADLTITINSTGEKIIWEGFALDGPANILNSIRFDDDTEWYGQDILERITRIGTDGDDDLSGTFANDRLVGGEGNDTLEGNESNDTFVFADNFGNDIVTDLEDDDIIEFSGNTFDSYAAVLAAMVEDGQNTVITLDADNSITLNNVAIADLQVDDFRFV